MKTIPGQLVETGNGVDSVAELSGVCRHVGAGGAVERPTRVDGPAIVFQNEKGHKDVSVVIGVLVSRESCHTFRMQKEELSWVVQECVSNPIELVIFDRPVPCQGASTGHRPQILICLSSFRHKSTRWWMRDRISRLACAMQRIRTYRTEGQIYPGKICGY